MNNLLRKIGGTLGVAAALSFTSCIGPNNAYNGISSWNSKLSESKWVNELAFLGLNIIPVYPIVLWGDYLIFNSVEFWTGDNWIAKPEAFKPQEVKK